MYFGPADDPLRIALADFAEAVTDADAVTDDQSEAFDVAVLRMQSAEVLPRVRTLLKPGGTLYVEIHRRMGRDVPWELRRYAATVERAGFRQVEAFWNWPNFTRWRPKRAANRRSMIGRRCARWSGLLRAARPISRKGWMLAATTF